MNPNKTVAKAAKRRPFDADKQAKREANMQHNREPFMNWLFAQAKAGRAFVTLDEAKREFDSVC